MSSTREGFGEGMEVVSMVEKKYGEVVTPISVAILLSLHYHTVTLAMLLNKMTKRSQDLHDAESHC